eukprot:3167290-Pleurochrysis_carterae.AAC.1
MLSRALLSVAALSYRRIRVCCAGLRAVRRCLHQHQRRHSTALLVLVLRPVLCVTAGGIAARRRRRPQGSRRASRGRGRAARAG